MTRYTFEFISVYQGRYMGQRPGGSDVVAWLDNAKGRARSYNRALRNYAKGV